MSHDRVFHFRRLVLFSLTAGVILLLVGCGGQTVVRGKVISGPVGQSLAVSPQDERFEEPGIPGAEVTVLTKAGSAARGRGVYATGVSGEDGMFELAFPSGSFPREAVRIRVEGEGIFTSRSQTFMPSGDDRILCVVITRPGYVAPDQNQDAVE